VREKGEGAAAKKEVGRTKACIAVKRRKKRRHPHIGERTPFCQGKSRGNRGENGLSMEKERIESFVRAGGKGWFGPLRK